MALTTLFKQSTEIVWRSFDFTLGNPAASVLTIFSVVSVNQKVVAGSANITFSQQNVNGSFVNLLIAGGTNGEVYEITVIVNTADGQKLTLQALLYITDF